ncbi:MAG: hypothetical protein DRJ96_05825 [Thermoprotei archaeon]|nr:MAG: hypothetical protein DRJ67_02060 [Thermoprotei archaeon]RLE96717.1 MAG: hypothetical protein DRJ96_05825 [Thermoprotei archaeon]
MKGLNELLGLVARAAETVEGAGDKRALLVSHYDADGLAAASILAHTLVTKGFAVQVVILEQLTPSSLARLERIAPSYPLVIIADMGSSALRELAKLQARVIVMDHHMPGEACEDVVEVNPHRVGVDGSREVSSAGLAYLLSKELIGESAVRHSPLAVVGALGDRQDVGRRFRLIGVNRLIVEEGVSSNLIGESIGLRIFGGARRPLIKALAYTTDPFIPGITGDESGALAFLKSIGVSPSRDGEPRTMGDLSREERKKLASALVKHLISLGYPVSEAERIYGATYTILSEPEGSPLRDAREYAQLLNANGRMGRYGLAIALGMGARGDTLMEAVNVAGQYRGLLAKAFKCVREEDVVSEGAYYVLVDLRGRTFLNERMSGALASLLTPSLSRDKLLVVAVDAAEGIKLSVRRGRDSIKVNVGEILRRAAQLAGGVGGGHENAGGATIPAEKLGEFLRLLDKEVARIAGSRS